MLKLIVAVTSLAIISVRSAPQLSDAELKQQSFNRINEAEYDYKWDFNPGNHGLSSSNIFRLFFPDLPSATVTSRSSFEKKSTEHMS